MKTCSAFSGFLNMLLRGRFDGALKFSSVVLRHFILGLSGWLVVLLLSNCTTLVHVFAFTFTWLVDGISISHKQQ